VKQKPGAEKNLQYYGLFEDGCERLGTLRQKRTLSTQPTTSQVLPFARISTSANNVKLFNPLHSIRFAERQIESGKFSFRWEYFEFESSVEFF
jgi:hypothetical protein